MILSAVFSARKPVFERERERDVSALLTHLTTALISGTPIPITSVPEELMQKQPLMIRPGPLPLHPSACTRQNTHGRPKHGRPNQIYFVPQPSGAPRNKLYGQRLDIATPNRTEQITGFAEPIMKIPKDPHNDPGYAIVRARWPRPRPRRAEPRAAGSRPQQTPEPCTTPLPVARVSQPTRARHPRRGSDDLPRRSLALLNLAQIAP